MTTAALPAPVAMLGATAPDPCNAVIRAVQLWPLPGQAEGLPQGLAEPLAACAVPPAGPAWAEHRNRFALCLVADAGIGWAAPISETVARIIVDDHVLGLIGHDATQPRRLPFRATSGRHREGVHARSAASAIELACWDLASQATGRSITELLGGTVRAQVPAYASSLGLDPCHPAAAEAARFIANSGWWGQKWPLPKQLLVGGPREVARVLGPIREAIGAGRFMVDGLRRCRRDEAQRLLPVLAELDVAWAEELEVTSADRMLGAGRQVPLAAGEHAVEAGEQLRLITSGAVDVWQPDPTWSGGLARALHTIDLAAGHGIRSFPHGSHLAAAVALGAVCCRDVVPAVEYHLTVEPHRQAFYEQPIIPDNGHLLARTTPGLVPRLKLAQEEPLWSTSS